MALASVFTPDPCPGSLPEILTGAHVFGSRPRWRLRRSGQSYQELLLGVGMLGL